HHPYNTRPVPCRLEENDKPSGCRPNPPRSERSMSACLTTPADSLLSTPSHAKPKEWTPHFWIGCGVFAWVRLLAQSPGAVACSKCYVAAAVSAVSTFNTSLSLLQHTIYGRSVSRTSIRRAPIFIIGHWRTGTTLLHEMLIRDPRHAFPTTFECLSPHHFL